MPLHSSKNGFSLIELIFVIMLIGLLSVVIGRSLFQGYHTFFTAQNIAETDWQGLLLLERMVNDIHAIRTPSDIQTAQSSALTFINVEGSSIQYQLNGTSLTRNNQILATGIQSLNLTYLDQNGTSTAIPANIRYIGISPVLVQASITTSFSTLAVLRGIT